MVMDEADRIERLLALVLLHEMKGASQREKAHQLSLAGFSNVEMANLLQTTSAVISQYLYETRKKTKSGGAKKLTAKKPVSKTTSVKKVVAKKRPGPRAETEGR